MQRFNATMVGIAAASVMAAMATPASAAVLTFDAADACIGGCGNGDKISQSYGDTAFMDVSYSSLSGFGNSSVVEPDAFYWDSDYGDLADVAFGGTDTTHILQITFTALNGATLKLNSFDSAGWPFTSYNSTVKFYDLSYNPIESIDFIAPGTGHYAFVCNGCTISGGFIIQLGPNGYDVGIDNIDVTAVPEPASWAMLIAGFGLTGAALRRRRLVAA